MAETAPSKRVIASDWIDYEIKSPNCVSHLTAAGLPLSLVEAALTPGALPKVETDSGATLILLRIYDRETTKRSTSTRELTRKLAVFITPTGFITVHRFPSSDVPGLLDPTGAPNYMGGIILRALQTYANAVIEADESFDSLEAAVFQPVKSKPFRLREAYSVKRRLNIIRKMLKLHFDMMETLASSPETEKFLPSPKKSARKRATQLLANCETLIENMNQLMQFHLAIESQKTNEASQRTNEVMRVLTVFSVFFLPLSFIAGVYGMNFKSMPELEHPHGYAGSLILMGGVASGIFLWFRKRGWIGDSKA